MNRTKKCHNCGRSLPKTDFGWNNKAHNVRRGTCKRCRNAMQFFQRRGIKDKDRKELINNGECRLCKGPFLIPHFENKRWSVGDDLTIKVIGKICGDCYAYFRKEMPMVKA